MARPLKNSADYYPHDTDMRNDAKIKVIRKTHGATGYAVWAMLLEVLTDSDNFRIQVDEITVDLLAADFDLPTETLQEILNSFRRLKLIQYTDKVIFAPALFPRMEPLMAKRDRKRAWAERNKPIQDGQNGQNSDAGTSKTENSEVLDVQNSTDKDKDKDKVKIEGDRARARAREDSGKKEKAPPIALTPPGDPAWRPPDIDTEIDIMKTDDLCKERFIRQCEIPLDQYGRFTENFRLKLKSEQATPANTTDLRSYFFSWSRNEYKRETKQTTNGKEPKLNWNPNQTIRDGLDFGEQLQREREAGLI